MKVYERVASPMETRGAGIVVQGELIELLRTHGAGALPTTHCTVRRYLSPEGGEGEAQPAPQDFTSWEAIYRTLADAFPSDRYHRGAMLTDFGNGKGAVRAHIDMIQPFRALASARIRSMSCIRITRAYTDDEHFSHCRFRWAA